MAASVGRIIDAAISPDAFQPWPRKRIQATIGTVIESPMFASMSVSPSPSEHPERRAEDRPCRRPSRRPSRRSGAAAAVRRGWRGGFGGRSFGSGAIATPASKSTAGRIRASGRGSHQFHRPSSCIAAGTSARRTIVASTAIATAAPRPICWIDGRPVPTKIMNTATMISAALEIVRALLASPSATASPGVAGRLVALADAAEEEHLVVHRQAEHDGQDERRGDRLDLAEGQRQHAVGRAHRQQVHQDGLERQDHAAQQDQQQQERQAEDEQRRSSTSSRRPCERKSSCTAVVPPTATSTSADAERVSRRRATAAFASGGLAVVLELRGQRARSARPRRSRGARDLRHLAVIARSCAGSTPGADAVVPSARRRAPARSPPGP